jgi:hypothetical protein
MKIMFIDESGDHSLSVIDPQYPVFVLGGILVEKEYAEGPLTQEVNHFKRDLFGREDIILHTSDIVRNRHGFEKLQDASFRKTFYDRLNSLMRSLQYQVVACVIKKDAHLERYGMGALDPYMLSLEILAERFCFEIGNKEGGGIIVAEKRGPTLDHELDLAWLNLKIRGTHFIQAKDIERRISGLVCRDKQDNVAGLQLADLVVSPIGRYVLGKVPKEDFKIVESKFRRDFKGNYTGMGLVVLPKK